MNSPPSALDGFEPKSSTVVMGLLDRYRAEAQLDARADAIVYLGRSPRDGRRVEIRLPREPDRWRKRILLASLVHGPFLRPVLDCDPDHQAGFVLPASEGGSLAQFLAAKNRLAPAQALLLATQLARSAAECHLLGLAIGRIHPDAIEILPDQTPFVDIVGVGGVPIEEKDVSPFELPPLDRAEEEEDVGNLARIIALLLTGSARGGGARAISAIREAMVAAGTIGPGSAETLQVLGATMDAALSRELELRPSAGELCRALDAVIESFSPEGGPGSNGQDRTVFQPGLLEELKRPPAPAARRLGRYELLSELGRGGMGTVYRARDDADGAIVALKVVSAGDLAGRPHLVRRFRKEARLLGRLDSPRIVRLLDVNENNGTPYYVMELIPGRSLSDDLLGRPMAPDAALDHALGIAEALADAHEAGIVHRDVKPSNILIVDDPDKPGRCSVKLVDFGLAREAAQSESMALTRTGAFLGTPTYMAPEQCLGEGEITPAADVYALGVILYEMLAGEPPFRSVDSMRLVAMHCYEKPPSLRAKVPGIADGLAAIVEKCLQKKPEARFADGGELCRELERLRRGEPANIVQHPILPDHRPEKIFSVEWTWDLVGSPEQLWPYISNTQRVNRAVGVPAVEYHTTADEGFGVRRFGRFRMAGMDIRWEEHPFEWVEGRRMAILREFTKGPFSWFLSVVELEPRPAGGTTLRHSVKIAPRNFFGRLIAAMEVSAKGRRNVDRLYRSIDQKVTSGAAADPRQDVFESPPRLSAAEQRRLGESLARLAGRGVEPKIVQTIGDFVETAAAIELARVRPLAFAGRFGLDPDHCLAAFLFAAREGLFELHWDVLCPKCRAAADVKNSLRRILDHAHCEVCAEDFTVDFANSIEMIFRVHPEIRRADLRTYCIGGPDHHPHVAAQVRLAPAERVRLELALGPGEYLVRGPQLTAAFPFRVEPGEGVHRWELALGGTAMSEPAGGEKPPVLRAGSQQLTLVNASALPLLVRLERAAGRTDAVTAAKAASLALFRELFPGEVLEPGRLVRVATTTFLAAEFAGMNRLYQERGDARAFEILSARFASAQRSIEDANGAIVRREREGLFATFEKPEDGFVAARALARDADGLAARVALHRGAALVMNDQDHIDYFGSEVHRTLALLRRARPRDIILSETIAADAGIAELLRNQGLFAEVVSTATSRERDGLPLRVRSANDSIGDAIVQRSTATQVDREGRVAGDAQDGSEAADGRGVSPRE